MRTKTIEKKAFFTFILPCPKNKKPKNCSRFVEEEDSTPHAPLEMRHSRNQGEILRHRCRQCDLLQTTPTKKKNKKNKKLFFFFFRGLTTVILEILSSGFLELQHPLYLDKGGGVYDIYSNSTHSSGRVYGLSWLLVASSTTSILILFCAFLLFLHYPRGHILLLPQGNRIGVVLLSRAKPRLRRYVFL